MVAEKPLTLADLAGVLLFLVLEVIGGAVLWGVATDPFGPLALPLARLYPHF